MIVQLRPGTRRGPANADLTAGQRYVVIGIEAGDYRLLDDRGKPYLYPRRLFRVVESSVPRDWIVTHGDDGEEYAYPRPLGVPGFFEDYFDGRPKAVATFWRLVNDSLRIAG